MQFQWRGSTAPLPQLFAACFQDFEDSLGFADAVTTASSTMRCSLQLRNHSQHTCFAFIQVLCKRPARLFVQHPRAKITDVDQWHRAMLAIRASLCALQHVRWPTSLFLVLIRACVNLHTRPSEAVVHTEEFDMDAPCGQERDHAANYAPCQASPACN